MKTRVTFPPLPRLSKYLFFLSLLLLLPSSIPSFFSCAMCGGNTLYQWEERDERKKERREASNDICLERGE